MCPLHYHYNTYNQFSLITTDDVLFFQINLPIGAWDIAILLIEDKTLHKTAVYRRTPPKTVIHWPVFFFSLFNYRSSIIKYQNVWNKVSPVKRSWELLVALDEASDLGVGEAFHHGFGDGAGTASFARWPVAIFRVIVTLIRIFILFVLFLLAPILIRVIDIHLQRNRLSHQQDACLFV